MNDLQDMIVCYLVGLFISERAMDRGELARLLQKFFPEKSLDELTETVSRVANGIGVRVKESPSNVSTETNLGPRF